MGNGCQCVVVGTRPKLSLIEFEPQNMQGQEARGQALMTVSFVETAIDCVHNEEHTNMKR